MGHITIIFCVTSTLPPPFPPRIFLDSYDNVVYIIFITTANKLCRNDQCRAAAVVNSATSDEPRSVCVRSRAKYKTCLFVCFFLRFFFLFCFNGQTFEKIKTSQTIAFIDAAVNVIYSTVAVVLAALGMKAKKATKTKRIKPS